MGYIMFGCISELWQARLTLKKFAYKFIFWAVGPDLPTPPHMAIAYLWAPSSGKAGRSMYAYIDRVGPEVGY